MNLRTLYGRRGERKYLNYAERLAFFEAVMKLESEPQRLFCLVLLHTGCRISEGLELQRSQLDRGGKALVFKTLKQKGDIVYRPVPTPLSLIDRLQALPSNEDGCLFDFKRTRGWEIVKECMDAAGIEGIRATPSGLRHGYGIGCITIDLYPAKIQELLGHKRAETTSIYTTYINDDVRELFKSIWFMEDA